MKIVLATANVGKVREFREILADGSTTDWSDLSQHRDVPVPEETGHTFRANACLKANYYAIRLKSWALADDSGLAVDALAGSPGVLSARWAKVNKAGDGDAANNARLLRQLENISDEMRIARFICVLALSNPQGEIVLTVQDFLAGRIIREPRGANGFGYDPLFLVTELGQTTAELPSDKKHQISHRGKALRRMHQLMTQVMG